MNKIRKISLITLPARSKGVGLIEILVSILVIGVGALGVASMQLTGLKFNVGSQGRTQAVFLATDMMDRMRANRGVALNDDTAYVLANLSVSADVGAPTDCYNAECTPEQLALFDQFYFLRQVEDLVPFGRASINHFDDADGDRIYEIQIEWRDVVGIQNRDGLTIDDANSINQFTFRSGL